MEARRQPQQQRDHGHVHHARDAQGRGNAKEFRNRVKPGGTIEIRIGGDYSITMTGSVNKVAEGSMHPELFEVKV